jgi:hypothetical protein
MPNILEVIRELKFLQSKQTAGTASAADLARIPELQAFMSGQKKLDSAPAGAPARPPARPAPAPARSAPAGVRPAEPVAEQTVRSAHVPKAPPAPARAAEPEPDANAFSLSLDDDLASALGEVSEPGDSRDGSRLAATTHSARDEELSNPFAISLDDAGLTEDDLPDDSAAARTTYAVDDEVSAAGDKAADNPFALEVPDDLENLDLVADNQGGLTHELDESELDGTADGGDPYRVDLKQDFAKKLEAADGSEAGAAPSTQGPKGTPVVPDAHYAKIAATDASVIVQFRDGRLAKGAASAFSPQTPAFTLNQLVAGKPPMAVKLEDCLTVRFVRGYNAGGGAAAPVPPKGAGPAAVTAGQRVSVKLLDGETLVGNALPHKEGESFILVPAVTTGNVRRVWVSARAVRTLAKRPTA